MAFLIDLTGKKFGEWEIICRAKTSNGQYHSWLCRCKCGKEKILGSNYIRKTWKPTDCGCSNTIVGKKFGMLLVTEHLGKKCNTLSKFKCICDCGREKITYGSYLIHNKIKSCGCNLSKKTSEIGPRTVFNHYKQASKKRNFEFKLTKAELKQIIEMPCHYCGEINSNIFRIHKTKNGADRYYSYNGIDRVDNESGYLRENCVTCCKTCNLMKRGLAYEQWLNHMQKILNHVQSKQRETTAMAV